MRAGAPGGQGCLGRMEKSEMKDSLLPNNDLENQATAEISRINEDYVALSGTPENEDSKEAALGYAPLRSGRSKRAVLVMGSTLAILLLLGVIAFNNLCVESGGPDQLLGEDDVDGDPDYENEFYTASRTGFHFQPLNNWMNDPNAPLFYKGYYHFFYQYNPKGVRDPFVQMHWGHSVSTDLIHWEHLEIAMWPDKWYDVDGVWSGSATILKDGTPAIIYTGARNMTDDACDQTQNLALPVDPSDPLLRQWKKVDINPILFNPKGIKANDFRDPTTAWLEGDGPYRFTVGAKRDNADGTHDGLALLYKSDDFVNWELEKHIHEGVDTGMWECLDFYPIALKDQGGQNHSMLKVETFSDKYKYVLKAGLQVWEQDHYVIGTYSTDTHTFTVDEPKFDLGHGSYRYDYGKFYASKSFYDPSTGRRIVWGWSNESDSRKDQVIKGWASVQAIPRVVRLDEKMQTSLLVWPVEELEALRGEKTSHENIKLRPTDVIKVAAGDGKQQLDIEVVFEMPDVSNVVGKPEKVDFDCGQGGSAHRGVFGPFGLLVHADDDLTEHTGIFFYISMLNDGHWATRACSDQSRSSLASGLDKTVYGSFVPLLATDDELSMRIIVDHSIVETFVQGGRFAITSRVYPTVAYGPRTRLFLFNNGTTTIHVKSFDVYPMASVNMTNYSDT